ncbi:MAG: hypothetical protein Q8R12_04035 [bacterium]|nr:hypothetical protein [bacterium]
MQLIPVIDQMGIMEVVPHRPPKLLIDGITDLEEMSVEGFRDVSLEDCEGNVGAILPGGHMYEMLAQILSYRLLSFGRFRGFYAVPKQFRLKPLRPVFPGDHLILHVDIRALKSSSSKGYAKGRGYVEGRLVFEASGGFRVMRPEVFEAMKQESMRQKEEMATTARGILSLATDM